MKKLSVLEHKHMDLFFYDAWKVLVLMKEMRYFSKLGEMKATLIIWGFDTCIASILGV